MKQALVETRGRGGGESRSPPFMMLPPVPILSIFPAIFAVEDEKA